ncbi:membrane protein [Microbacterium sp. MRS-1]|uniref:membrane protein n=1 Tax=Microbacterium sp. MRS-1 TaxID=1451261 RepID=UPI000446CD2B|nr:membrane protein [Microbacterium sp. MRS-1]EXJ52939.1 membrane protein [Microbacterium sp. MRS-1]
MAERALTAEAAPRGGTGPLGRLLVLRPAVAVAVVYLAARLITTAFLLIAAELSGPTSRFGADATIGTLSMGWDAQWYWVVGSAGYPAHLPVDATGAVTQNAWAFMPVYPALTRVLSVAFAGNYPLAAVVLAIVAGYGACLVFFHLLREKLTADTALWAVALLAASPLAALFQMGYAESLFLLWLFLALWLLVRRRFVWLYPLIVVMGYTRPGVLAFALLLGAYGVVRWLRRRDDPLPTVQVVHIVALGVLAVAVGFSWQVIAGAVTGDPAAYMETELSWRRGWIGEGGFVPFDGFVQGAALWFRLWGLPESVAYVALAAAVVAVAAVIAFEPHVRRLGPEMRLWSASYVLYLLVVFFPQSSIFRLLLPLAPLYGAMAAPRHPVWRWGALLVGLIGQWWWIYQMLAIGNSYTQIP